MDIVNCKTLLATKELELSCIRAATTAAAAASSLEFLDLGVDCLLDFCDRLDIATLSAVAGTCPRMWDIAHSSFVRRKITRFSYSWRQAEEHEYCTWNSAEFVELLVAFGDLITDVCVRLENDCSVNIKIFNEVVLWSGDTLRSLELYDYADEWDSDQLVNAGLFFTNMTYFDFHFYAIPWDVRQRSIELKNRQRANNYYSNLHTYLGHTFPKLKSFELHANYDYVNADIALGLQADFNNFMRRHSQLTDVTVKGFKLSFAVLTELPNLESITIGRRDEDRIMALVGLQRPKSIRFDFWIRDGAIIIEFVNRLAARETLEELDFRIFRRSTDATAFWQCLGRLRGLRVLKLAVDSFADRELADGIEVLVGNLPRIERLEIRQRGDEEFQMHAYSRLDALCHGTNIAVDVLVDPERINAEDLPRFSKGSYVDTIRFGRRV